MPAVSTQLNDFIMPRAEHASQTSPVGTSWFARLASAFTDARSRQAERQVAQLITLRGGRMTDDLERQIERQFI